MVYNHIVYNNYPSDFMILIQTQRTFNKKKVDCTSVGPVYRINDHKGQEI